MKRFRIKLSTLIAFVLAIMSGAALFWVSQRVQQLESEQRKLGEEISSEKEGMRVLAAEWDYLNRPERIEALAAKYLNTMTPVSPDNLLKDAKAVPEPQMMQEEDSTPVLVSTGAAEDKKEETQPVSAAPAARPIRDADDSKTTDFNGVLKDTMGDDDQ